MLAFFYPVLHGVQSFVDFLGGSGAIVLAIGALLAAPYVEKLLLERKRLTYRVLYDRKIGVVPDDPDRGKPIRVRFEGLGDVAELLERMSIVVIRIQNTGRSNIRKRDMGDALSFSFEERNIWNARIDDATSDQVRENTRAGMEFFSPDDDRVVRGSLKDLRTEDWDENNGPKWQAVRFKNLRLDRGDKFKLVVVLVQPPDSAAISQGVDQGGRFHERGVIKNDAEERPLFTLKRVAWAVAVVLIGLLVIVPFAPPPPDHNVACASGQLTVTGSTAFMPMVRELADQYQNGCRGAMITTQPNGSLAGIREVAHLNHAQADTLIALSDGKVNAPEATDKKFEKLAIVIYRVIVNPSAGVDNLTTVQLQGIFNGTYRDWNQLRGGASLPIRIVARNGDSGSRALFDQRVLQRLEPGLTSNGCLTNDLSYSAPVIRCERSSDAEAVQQVSTTPGAISYADMPTIAEALKGNSVTALTLDHKAAFDINTAIETGYPFWTAEYLYSLGEAGEGSLYASFLNYLRTDDNARLRLREHGYLPCITPDGQPLDLCSQR